MNKLSKEQAAFIGCYTGIVFGPFADVHELAEKTLGRPIFTHEFADQKIHGQLQEKLRSHLESICYSGKVE